MKNASRGRDVAKFFAGWAAGETFGHWLLGLLGTDMFPVTVGRFTFTSTWNLWAMAIWPVVLAALVYASWPEKERAESQAAAPPPTVPT